MDLAIHITPDRLSAVLDLPAGRHVDIDTLRQLLTRCNICHGLSHNALAAAIQPGAADRSLVIARGDPPKLGPAGSITPALADGTPVIAGQRLGHWQLPHAGEPGIGIDGHPVPASAGPSGVGIGMAIGSDGQVVAMRAGIIGHDVHGRPAVLLGEGVIDRLVEEPAVQIDATATLAWIDFAAGEYARPSTVERVMAAAGVVQGIDRTVVAATGEGVPHQRRMILAQATPAVAGVDGRIELLIQEGVHLITDEHGRVDWHELGLIHEVAANQAVARVVVATAGTPGRDVRGGILAPKPGHEPDLGKVLGDGVRLRVDDATVIEAALPGIYVHGRGGRIDISPVLLVAGDVDLHHGNIDTTLSVVVKGDIRSGFTVKSAGDIEVHGVIEDARVSAKGNLLVKGGILAGAQRVKAQGDVTARYINGREVKGRDIRISGSIRSSSVLATGAVSAKDIAASKVIAHGDIVCDTLGAPDQSRTTVQAGINPFEETIAALARQEHDRLAQEVVTLKERCNLQAHHLKSLTGADAEEGARTLQETFDAFNLACERMTRGESILQRHDQMLADPARVQPTATITVRGTAHAGAEVLLGERLRLTLPRDLTGPRFQVKDGELGW